MLYRIKIEQYHDTELLFNENESEEAFIALQGIKTHLMKDIDGHKQRVILQVMTAEELEDEAKAHREIMETIRAKAEAESDANA